MREPGKRFEVQLRAAEKAGSSIPVVQAPWRQPREKLSPALQVLADSHGRALLSVLVDFRDQLDFERLGEMWNSHWSARAEQRAFVIRALAEISRNTQERFTGFLRRLQKQGLVEGWEKITIVNRMVVRCRPAALRSLAQQPAVLSLTEEIEAESNLAANTTLLPREKPQRASPEDSIPWALETMGVQKAWAEGADGRGVVVGIIDSGASAEHEQLAENFRGGTNSWFDPVRKSDQPVDALTGHGTGVLSCAVGRPATASGLGVAPGAKWIAAAGLVDGKYNNIHATEAADWMLNSGQPDVLVIPWQLPGSGCDFSMKRMVNAWRAAGILVVFAAGNSGPNPGSDVSPANYTCLFPGFHSALSAGGFQGDGKVYEKSSRGPGHCGHAMYPQLVAPGADVLVAFPAGPSLYRRVSGTSFAAGYVAGAAALLLSRQPGAQVEEIEQALRCTAKSLGDSRPNSSSGYGLVNLPAALAFLDLLPEKRNEICAETR